MKVKTGCFPLFHEVELVTKHWCIIMHCSERILSEEHVSFIFNARSTALFLQSHFPFLCPRYLLRAFYIEMYSGEKEHTGRREGPSVALPTVKSFSIDIDVNQSAWIIGLSKEDIIIAQQN